MKMMKHARTDVPNTVSGQLLGSDVKDVLEVTNSFPFPVGYSPLSAISPNSSSTATVASVATPVSPETEAQPAVTPVVPLGQDYAVEMTQQMKAANVDHQVVGWYTSTYFSTFLTTPLASSTVPTVPNTAVTGLNDSASFVETQFKYQSHPLFGGRMVCLVYDPVRSQQSGEGVWVRAVRLTDEFMKLYGGVVTSAALGIGASDREKRVTVDALKESGLTYADIIEYVPVEITNSALGHAFLATSTTTKTNSTLDLTPTMYFEKSLEVLTDALEQYSQDHYRFSRYVHQHMRQQQALQHHLNKRRYQQSQTSNGTNANTQVSLSKEEEEEVMAQLNFRQIQQPSRLDALILRRQVEEVVEGVREVATVGVGKLKVVSELHQCAR